MSADLNQETVARVHYDFLDGIRAVAVSLVVLFHFDLLGLPGGFLGVDMFFVISGFLVSDLILRNIASGNFSLLRFFERRVYRILPALYASLIFVMVAGYFLLLPVDLAQTAVSARASALLFANIHFHSTIEYFNQGSRFWMLLHHWSLSVEEQFYLIFPFVLVLLSALKVPLRRVIPLLLIAALLYSLSLSMRAPSAAFYLVQARFWEFLVGAQIAILPRAIKMPRGYAEAISVIAISAILMSARWVSEPSDLHRLATVVPVAATAALIWANINSSSTRVGRLLSIGWVRKIGLISYSMYILHWPFILFAQYWAIEPLSLIARLAVLAAMVTASWLSWRYIEQPFRAIPAMNIKARRIGIISIAATTALIVSAASWIIANKGFEGRQSVRVTAALAGQKAYSPDRTRCHSHETTNSISPEEACILGADTKPTIAVWSDSHGVELAYEIGKSQGVLGKSVLQMTSSSCPPTLGYTPPTIRNCAEKNRKKLEFLLKNANIKHVVLAMSNEHFMRANPPQLEGTIRELLNAGKMVILIKAVPRAPFNVPHAQARMAYFGRPLSLGSASLVSHQNASAVMNAQSDVIPKGTDFKIVDPADDFCNGSLCYNSVKGEMLYFDDNHPSLYGAHLIAKRVIDVISLAEK
jgi:peptidoglycan/LPS O-acetylase OafA/YrhL